jgi:hypothetical protein
MLRTGNRFAEIPAGSTEVGLVRIVRGPRVIGRGGETCVPFLSINSLFNLQLILLNFLVIIQHPFHHHLTGFQKRYLRQKISDAFLLKTHLKALYSKTAPDDEIYLITLFKTCCLL